MRKNRALWLVVALLFLATNIPIVHAGPGDTSSNCTTSTASRLDCNEVGVYGVEMRGLLAEMAAHPHPDVTPIPIDEHMLYSQAYRRILQESDIYDAPGGAAISHIDAGFNFVNAGRIVNGWVEIRPNQWMPEKVLGPVNKAVSKFAGVLLPSGFPDRPFGWVLLDTKLSRSPGAKPISGTPLTKRYTLVNIFAVERVNGWDWYLVGPDQWIVQTRIARLQPVKRPDGVSGKWFAVDLYEQTLTAFQDDKPVFVTLISSGLPKWPTTEGLTKINDRHEKIKMSGHIGQPDFYFLPEVPYVMYFNPDQQALHGAYWHDGFGYRHSHGCVNMSMTDANWAFDWTKDSPDASVYVYHSGDYKIGGPR